MPYITETLRHDSFLDDLFYKVFRRFEDKTSNKWWQDFNDKTPKVDMYKITFEKGLFVKGAKGFQVPASPREGNLCVTRHMIIRRWDNQYLAFAQSTGSVKINTEDLPTDKTELMKWFVNFYRDFVDFTTVYAYTMEEYQGYTHYEVPSTTTVAPVTVMADDGGFGVLRGSLDIEYYSEEEYYPDTMQSPILTMNLKGDTGEHIASVGKLNFKTNTNWWDDSLIQIKGVVDETSIYFTMKVDSAPSWEDNSVTVVPFFFGNLVTKDATNRNETPIAMFGGTQVGKFFNFDSIEEKNDVLQPITRNYINHPSNGVDTIMVKKTKYGARYQEHFIRWNAPPNLMPPTREEIRLAGGDLELAKPQTVGSLPDLFTPGDSTIYLGWYSSGNNSYPIAGLYSGARYVIIGDEEIASLQSVDLVNSTITLSRKSSKEWAAGTPIKAYTSEALAEITRKYPRAWNYLRFGYYQYDMHPSRYSDKIHTSRATVMHPEDGVIGYVPNIVLLPVVNIMNEDKLKFPYWCAECTEEPYNPATPETPDLGGGWNPVPDTGTTPTTPPTNPPVEPSTPPTSGSFAYMCDNSVAASTIDSTYWNPEPSLQNFMKTTGLGREISKEFWQGRNDWLEFFGSPSDSDGVFNSPASKVVIGDFHSFLWKAIQDVKAGTQKNDSSWTDFNTWATADLTCLTELERASLFMSTKLAKPVMFFPSSEGFLAGDILDNMIPAIEKVPTEVYDFMDFNNVFVESVGSNGIVGAWVRDSGLMSENQATGVITDGAPSFKSMVSFEPQLLQYGLGSAKANRPFDYLKTQPGASFGSPVVGGEYTSYYKPEMTDTNFTPFVAAEIAVHEMGHALSNYGRDKLGTVLHEMPDWLAISWGVDSKGKWNGINPTKSKPGTLLDNGKLAPVSDYGCFQPAEDFAEAFMMYVINKPFLKDKFKAKHDFIATKLQAMGINPNL